MCAFSCMRQRAWPRAAAAAHAATVLQSQFKHPSMQRQQQQQLAHAPVPGAASREPPSGCQAAWGRAEDAGSTCAHAHATKARSMVIVWRYGAREVPCLLCSHWRTHAAPAGAAAVMFWRTHAAPLLSHAACAPTFGHARLRHSSCRPDSMLQTLRQPSAFTDAR